MKKHPTSSRYAGSKFAIKLIAILAIITPASSQLYAQQVYKSVDKNGRITYSEVPPLPSSGDKLTADSAASVSLPYALQQVVSRYPVTLYTTAECGPCINARLMLTRRGVPFKELTVSSNEDITAYKKLSTDINFPLISIAAQQLKGYEETELTKYLDAAGYPQSSSLPRNYRNPEPTSLTPKKAVEKAEKTEKTEEAKPVATNPKAAPTVNNTANPAGIRF